MEPIALTKINKLSTVQQQEKSMNILKIIWLQRKKLEQR